MPEATGRDHLQAFYRMLGTAVIGQKRLADRLLIALLTDGHVLLEGLPGLAKTLTIRALAAALALKFQRIQFTPDLLPADVIGTQIYSAQTGQFSVKTGPIFANVVLADEINRAPAKVQSALLEAMQETQVTLGERTYPLPRPFFVLATQNPLEQEGTYPLPEAQVDRFMFKLILDYPSRDEELQILARWGGVESALDVTPVLDGPELAHWRQRVDGLYVDVKMRGYIVDLSRATRKPAEFDLGDLTPLIQAGASPRASVALLRAAKGHAFLHGRDYVAPEDVKSIARDVLRHRVLVTYEAEAADVTSDAIVERVLNAVPVP